MFDTCPSSTSTIEVTFGGVQTERLGLAPMADRFSPTEIVDQMGRLNGWHQFEDSPGRLSLRLHQRHHGRGGGRTAVTGWEDLDLPRRYGSGGGSRRCCASGASSTASIRSWSGRQPATARSRSTVPAQGANIMEHWDSMVRGFREQIGWDSELGLPLPKTLRELDLQELIPVVEKISAERGAVLA